jgi:hypothetical protein
MSGHYRAIISVPIAAEDDDRAYELAVEYAHSLHHPGGNVVAGHLELLGELEEGGFQMARPVAGDPGFLRLPPDWKP